MKLSNGKQPKKINCLALAFAIPCVGMLVFMLIAQCEPFGKYSMLYSDMYHQYYPFFLAFRRALLSGDSLLYSWNVGLGMDYLGLISYYLASPLYLLSVFVPEGWMLEFFALLMPVKLGLAGLFFAIFLKNVFGKDDLSVPLFSAMYALCAWALGYQWNIMWLDTFALVPLVALGTICLIRDKKFILYTLSLFLAVYSNYYIGFFVCIFVALLFFVYQICRCRSIGRFFADLGRIAFFSLLAIGMTAILELPAFAALQTTQSSVNNFPKTFDLNIVSENTFAGLLDAMRQVAGNMSGGIEPTWKEGLPNLFCGVGTVFMAALYLLSRDVKLRDKLCAAGLLLLFSLSFVIRQLDYIWHGFHFTNMIPYRFSFLYSFVMLYMAYKAWTVRENFRLWQLLAAGALSVGVFLCSESKDDSVFQLYNLSFLLLYLVTFAYGQFRRKLPKNGEPEKAEREMAARLSRRSNAAIFLLAVLTVEIVMNLVNFGTDFSRTNASNYPKGTDYTASMIRYMKEREEDTLFFRAEMTHAQTLNDGALNSYNGISTFTSSANVKVTEFMKALGYGAKNTYNRYCWEEASPVSNLFLGLKYMLDRDGKDKASSVFSYIHHYGNTYLYENEAYLPLGFLAESALAEVDFTEGSAFAFQNTLFAAATGVEGEVWHRLKGDSLTITGEDVTVTSQNSSGYCEYQDAAKGSHVIYSYVADQDGFMCIHLNLPKRNGVVIRLNGVELYTETTSLAQMMAVGDVKVGDVIDVVLSCKENEKGTTTLSAAILDMDRFWQGYEVLNASTLELTSFRNTRVEGYVEADRDGLLYTSIPQNGNWTVQVDGEDAEIVLVGDAMIAVELTEGYHEITFRYRNEAFALGWKISLLCFAVFAGLVWLIYKPKLKPSHGEYEK